MISQFRPISHLMVTKKGDPISPMWEAVLIGFLLATAVVWVVHLVTLGGYDGNGQPYVENYGASIGFIHIVLWVFVAWLMRGHGKSMFEWGRNLYLLYIPAPLKHDASHDASTTGTDPGVEQRPPTA